MRLEIKVELDEYAFFRSVRVGNWVHWFDYETGTGEWAWRPLTSASTCDPTMPKDVQRFAAWGSALTAEAKTQRMATFLERVALRKD